VLIYAIMRLKPDTTIDAVLAHGKNEARAVWAQITAGPFRKVSLTSDRPGAVIEIEGADVGAAETAMATLPLVRDGLVTVEYLPVGPYRNLEAIFAT
jgi:hypothetical protein